MQRERTLENLNKRLKRLRKYAPKRRIASALGCSPQWISMVFRGLYISEDVLEIGWNVLETCEELREKDMKDARNKVKRGVAA